jgi:hypothetical protein
MCRYFLTQDSRKISVVEQLWSSWVQEINQLFLYSISDAFTYGENDPTTHSIRRENFSWRFDELLDGKKQ